MVPDTHLSAWSGCLHSALRAAPFGKRHRDYSKRDAASLKLWKITEKWCHLAALSILGVIRGWHGAGALVCMSHGVVVCVPASSRLARACLSVC